MIKDNIELFKDSEKLKIAFPEIAKFVVKQSPVEVLASYFISRPDKDIRGVMNKPVTLKDADTAKVIEKYLPKFESIDGENLVYCINGTMYTSEDMKASYKDIVAAVNLVTGKHPFMKEITKLKTRLDSFKSGSTMPLMLATTEEIQAVLTKINFKFTTLDNLLASVGLTISTYVNNGMLFEYIDTADRIRVLGYDENNAPVMEVFDI